VTFKEHCLECEKKLGEPFERVHLWLDEYAKHYHDPFTKHWHWLHRHHFAGIEDVRHKWGDQAAQAAELHIVSDMGKIYSSEELEDLITTNKLEFIER
jgi:hypothetical protein